MSRNGKMEIQNIVDKILSKHNIDASKDFYLKLTMPPYTDLVLERKGDIILVGHYREENGDLISDPVLAKGEKSGLLYELNYGAVIQYVLSMKTKRE